MSWRHIEAAGPLDLPQTMKSVLFVLAHHAQDHTGLAWPGLERLCLFTGLARRAVQMAIKNLENEGLIEVKRGGWRDGRNVSSLYTLTLPNVRPIDVGTTPPEVGGASHAPPPSGRGASGARGGASGDTEGVHEVHPNTRLNTNERVADARASNPWGDDWQPSAPTIERIKRDEGLSDSEIERERKSFILRNQAEGNEPRYKDAAFRQWCSRVKGLKHPLPAPATKPTSSADLKASEPIDTTDDADARLPVIRHELLQRLGQQTYEGWLSPERVALRCTPEGALVVLAQTRFMADWIRTHFDGQLRDAAFRQDFEMVVVEIYEPERAAA